MYSGHSSSVQDYYSYCVSYIGGRVGHPTPTETPPSTSEAPPTTSHTPISTVQPVQPTTHHTSPTTNRGEIINATPSPNTSGDGRRKGSTGLTNNIPNKDKPASSSASDKSAIQSRDDECGKYGCDGSGIVAVVVVGVICFVIVLVVIVILLKKVVDDRRKRRFKNVDYLINGMYT